METQVAPTEVAAPVAVAPEPVATEAQVAAPATDAGVEQAQADVAATAAVQ